MESIMSAFKDICKDAGEFALDVVTFPYRSTVEIYRSARMGHCSVEDPKTGISYRCDPRPRSPVVAALVTAKIELVSAVIPGALGFVCGPAGGLVAMVAANVGWKVMNAGIRVGVLFAETPAMPRRAARKKLRSTLVPT